MSMTNQTVNSVRTFAGLPIRSTVDVMETRKVSIAIYGRWKAGKTWLAATAADSEFGSPVVILDAEGGTRELPRRSDVEVIEIVDWDQLDRIYRAMVRGEVPWKTVVLDNMSEYQEVNINTLLRKKSYNDMRQMYRDSTQEILRVIRGFRDMARNGTLNVVFNLWDRIEKDENTKAQEIDMGFTPTLAHKFAGVADMIGYLELKSREPFVNVLHFNNGKYDGRKFEAGMRRRLDDGAANLPLEIWNPNLGTMLDSVIGGKPWPKDKHAPQRPTSSLVAPKKEGNNDA